MTAEVLVGIAFYPAARLAILHCSPRRPAEVRPGACASTSAPCVQCREWHWQWHGSGTVAGSRSVRGSPPCLYSPPFPLSLALDPLSFTLVEAGESIHTPLPLVELCVLLDAIQTRYRDCRFKKPDSSAAARE